MEHKNSGEGHCMRNSDNKPCLLKGGSQITTRGSQPQYKSNEVVQHKTALGQLLYVHAHAYAGWASSCPAWRCASRTWR